MEARVVGAHHNLRLIPLTLTITPRYSRWPSPKITISGKDGPLPSAAGTRWQAAARCAGQQRTMGATVLLSKWHEPYVDLIHRRMAQEVLPL